MDTDPGIDDAVALLYLAAQPDVTIEAVGSVHGNVPAPLAAQNAARVLRLAGLPGVPVAVGAHRPMAQDLRTAEFVHGDDGLGGHAADIPLGRAPVPESAAEQLVRLARRHPGELTVLALGPLSNLGLALLLEPRLPELLREVVVMGGAIEAPGNITPHADANIAHDPEAADLLFASGCPVRLVSIDVTDRAARADVAWLDRLAAAPNERAQWITRVLKHYTDFYERLFSTRIATMHDAMAAAIALDPELATYRELPVDVELRGSLTRGRTLVDRRPFRLPGDPEPRPPILIVESVDSEVFLDRLLRALIG